MGVGGPRMGVEGLRMGVGGLRIGVGGPSCQNPLVSTLIWGPPALIILHTLIWGPLALIILHTQAAQLLTQRICNQCGATFNRHTVATGFQPSTRHRPAPGCTATTGLRASTRPALSALGPAALPVMKHSWPPGRAHPTKVGHRAARLSAQRAHWLGSLI
jgi:hypothetical protein